MNDETPRFFVRPTKVVNASTVKRVLFKSVGCHRQQLVGFVDHEKRFIFIENIKVYIRFIQRRWRTFLCLLSLKDFEAVSRLKRMFRPVNDIPIDHDAPLCEHFSKRGGA